MRGGRDGSAVTRSPARQPLVNWLSQDLFDASPKPAIASTGIELRGMSLRSAHAPHSPFHKRSPWELRASRILLELPKVEMTAPVDHRENWREYELRPFFS